MTEGSAPISAEGFRSETEITAATEALFDDMVLHLDTPASNSMAAINTAMRQIRPYEAALISDRAVELQALEDCWARRDLLQLESLIRAYFDRRQALVPQLAALMGRLN